LKSLGATQSLVRFLLFNVELTAREVNFACCIAWKSLFIKALGRIKHFLKPALSAHMFQM